MKRLAIILMVIVMFTSLFSVPAFAAEDEGTVKFYNFKYYNGFLYIKNSGYHYVCANTQSYEDSNYYFSKTKDLGDGIELWHIDLTKIAEKYKYEVIQIVDPAPILCSDKYIYIVINMYDKYKEGQEYRDATSYIMKIDKETGEYEFLDSPFINFCPYMVKKRNGVLYFNLPDFGLTAMDEDGKLTSVKLNLNDASYSQTSSKSKYMYGVRGSMGFVYNLNVFNCDTAKRIRTIKSVCGYSATDSKLYYGKVVDSRFRVYSANPSGSKPKSIFSTKALKNKDYELSRVTNKYIYYKVYDKGYYGMPMFYRYNRSTKKKTTVGYTTYTINSGDFRDGYFDPKG